MVLDDVGFGQVGTFGGPVPTPALDKLAAAGLRYNRFHTTAICGPSRAAANGTESSQLRVGVPGRMGNRISELHHADPEEIGRAHV